MDNLTYQIMTLIITIIGALLTYFVIPWLKTKTTKEKLGEIEKWVAVAVAAAEQMKAAGLIQTNKKEHVLEFIRDKGITITDEELDALIEAAVYELNKAKYLLYRDLQYYEAKLEETVDQE